MPQTSDYLYIHFMSLQKGAPKDTWTLLTCNKQESGQSTALWLAK